MFLKIRKKSNILNFSSLLFIFLPISLITGPFLTDFSISVIALIFLIRCFKNNNFLPYKKKIFYFFLIFWIYLIINSLFNNFNLDSLKISFFYIRFPLFLVACVYIIENEEKTIKFFYYVLFFSFSILILDGIIQKLTGTNIIGLKQFHPLRISSFFGDELILGSYISRLFPLFLGLTLFFFKNKKYKIILISIIIFFVEIIVFISGERASFFLLNLGLFFAILFLESLKYYRITLFIIIFINIILLSFIFKDTTSRIVHLTINQVKPMITGNSNYYFSAMHSDHYNTAINMFKENKLLGVGVKNFRKFCSEKKYSSGTYACSTHPHNTPLQILAEIGIVGFLFYSLLFLYLIFYFFKYAYFKFIKKIIIFSDFRIIISTTLVMTFWPFIPSGNVFNNWLNALYWLPVSFILINFNLKSKFSF